MRVVKIGDDYVNIEHVSMVSKLPARQGWYELYLCGVHAGEVEEWYASKLIDEMRRSGEKGEA